MKNYKKISLVLFMLMFNVLIFAQTGPGDDDGFGTLEDDDPAAASINKKLILIALIGTTYMFYKLKNSKKQLN
jgi:hypothetical protein